jgi:hypothetical protein
MAHMNSNHRLTAYSTKHRTYWEANQLYQLSKNFPVFTVTEGLAAFPQECATGILSAPDKSNPKDTNSEILRYIT